MSIDKNKILNNICYTELVYDRINKKLKSNFSKNAIETNLLATIRETPISNFEKIGKNFYILNADKNIKITVKSNTYRIITVDKITK